MAKKLSVLVPVYNVEKYLAECLDSILAQTYEDYEIIAINDGSADGSAEILKSYAQRYPEKFGKIIDKPNSGYGDSMNQALDKSKSEYIAIVEPDDFIDKTMFEDLLNLADKTRTDLIRSNYYCYKNGENKLHELDIKNIFLDPPAIWSALYRREFLNKNKIRFLKTPGASYQDTSFNFKTLVCADESKTIAYSTKAYYHYRTDNSGSSVKSAKKVFAVQEEFKEIENFLASHNFSESKTSTENKNSAENEKYQKLAQAAKFGAYHWNLLRLPDQEIKNFLPVMRKEFKTAQENGLLDKSYFPKKYWLSLSLLLKSEKLFLLAFRLYRCAKAVL